MSKEKMQPEGWTPKFGVHASACVKEKMQPKGWTPKFGVHASACVKEKMQPKGWTPKFGVHASACLFNKNSKGCFLYNWRKMTAEQKSDLLSLRKSQNLPWHSPPHIDGGNTQFHITASCFEHKHLIGYSPQRMENFESRLVDLILSAGDILVTWSILPNHYHVLVKTKNILSLLRNIGKLHGKTSFEWNGEENTRGRKVWCNSLETAIKSTSHYFSTINYIHNNPIHHGYVSKWEEWLFGNTKEYLEAIGKDKAMEIFKLYPISGYGKDWDPPEM